MKHLAETVLHRCDQLAGNSEEVGAITRRFLTPPVHQVHASLRSWMTDIGMSVRVDAVGNIVGRRPADDSSDNQTLMLGSHLDTVPNSGKYDGILGVLISLAVVEQLKADRLPFAIDVIGFSEEEGVRFALPFIGSKAIVGDFDPEWLGRKDQNGVTLSQAIRDFGLDPNRIREAAYSPDQVLGYIEPHIEQGPVLEASELPVGMVRSIVGQSRLEIRIFGSAGHAGTVPMELRRDALVGAATIVGRVKEMGDTTPHLRATVGRFVVSPNASNVIPGQVDLSLDIRHEDDAVRKAAVASILEFVQQTVDQFHLTYKIISHLATSSVHASKILLDAMGACIEKCGYKPISLASGAGHDAMVMAGRFPMAMLFIRHPGGVSHHPDERVEVEDVSVAINVMMEMIRELAGRQKV
jgi:allantoate deiminase